jgi:hypothetical protein
MGFMNASCSFTRLRIIDPIPAGFWQSVPAKLKQFALRDIDATADERAFGWVSFDDMLDPDWHSAPPEKGEYLAFSLRPDTRRIPPAVFKKHFPIAQREEMARLRDMGKTYIARERKNELKDQVKARLLRHFLPIPAEFNVVWNTNAQTIYFASTQTKMVDLFREHFTLTFDLRLEPLTPYQLAAGMLGEADIKALDKLEATVF